MKWWQKIIKTLAIVGVVLLFGFILFKAIFKGDKEEAARQYQSLVREIRRRIAEITQSETVVRDNIEVAEEQQRELETQAEVLEERLETSTEGPVDHNQVIDDFQNRYRNPQ